MRILQIIIMLVLASGYSSRGWAEVDPLAQYQHAVQIRMDDLVRGATGEFFEKSSLNPAELRQVITTPQFAINDGEARITSLDLKIVIISDHPPEVIRQLRQFIAQTLDREGFVSDQGVNTGSSAPSLTLTFDVQQPVLPILRFDFAKNWREYSAFALILFAFLSSLFFAGYILLLPSTWRKRREKALLVLQKAPQPSNEVATGPLVLPELPDENANQSNPLSSLDDLLETEKQRQNFPVWLDKSGVRMADVDAIKKAFEVLPFEEALDLLSCMDETDRNIVLNQLKLNGSVRSRIKKELLVRTPAFNR